MLFSALAGVALAHGVEAISTAHYLSDVPSFEEFVLRLRDARYRRDIRRYVHFRDQMDWISIPGRGGVMDFIGRFESLEADFQQVCERLGRRDLSLPQLRPGTGQDYREAFTSEMVDIVGEIYKRDISALGYDF